MKRWLWSGAPWCYPRTPNPYPTWSSCAPYRERDPLPEDVLLLVEVSETTLVQDRTLKLPLYQQAGLPEVWIVNLLEEVLEVYAFPHYLPKRHAKGEKWPPRPSPPGP
ncbi:Uma2 family endonuclease [Thermus sp.]|uniref:Uma2 family endonuclease n=1 Tax=Thermus sp. TaxID=275 RepID=UPI00307D1AA1